MQSEDQMQPGHDGRTLVYTRSNFPPRDTNMTLTEPGACSITEYVKCHYVPLKET